MKWREGVNEGVKGWRDEGMKEWGDERKKGMKGMKGRSEWRSSEWRKEGMKGWRDEGMQGCRVEGMKEWREGVNDGMKGWRDEGIKEWRDEGMKLAKLYADLLHHYSCTSENLELLTFYEVIQRSQIILSIKSDAMIFQYTIVHFQQTTERQQLVWLSSTK